MTDGAIRIEDVAFAYGATAMHFDSEVAKGEIVAVMGPSGSGKSTLLNLIAGFEQPDHGRILIAGNEVTKLPPAARPISMIFQENNLFSHLDVRANVGLGRSPALRLSTLDKADIDAAITQVGLEGKERRLPHQLSGGERQRVALARVLVRNRPVLLIDEPFAGLGPALRTEMLSLLRKLHAERGMTILMVTHEPDDAAAIADRIIYLENGSIVESGMTDMMLSGTGPAAFRHYLGHGEPS